MNAIDIFGLVGIAAIAVAVFFHQRNPPPRPADLLDIRVLRLLADAPVGMDVTEAGIAQRLNSDIPKVHASLLRLAEDGKIAYTIDSNGWKSYYAKDWLTITPPTATKDS